MDRKSKNYFSTLRENNAENSEFLSLSVAALWGPLICVKVGKVIIKQRTNYSLISLGVG
jgi:hypothetical protein